jgi:hypothetical protein
MLVSITKPLGEKRKFQKGAFAAPKTMWRNTHQQTQLSLLEILFAAPASTKNAFRSAKTNKYCSTGTERNADIPIDPNL